MTEMAKIFESQGLGTAASFVQAAKDPAPIRELDPAAKDLEGYLFPETYALPRRTDAAKLVRLMVAAFSARFTPELRAAAAARNLTSRQAVTLASIVEKETAKAGGAADRGRRLSQPAAHRHAAAVRPDGDLRAAARRPLHRQPAPRRSDVRLAVQHLSLSGAAARADRVARARRRSKRRRSPPTSTISTSSAATTARTSSRARSTSTTATCRSIRSSTSGISGGSSRAGRAAL